MASPKQLAIACSKACKRIEASIKKLGGENQHLPLQHRDHDELRKQQLEAIADLLEGIPTTKKTTKRKVRE